MLKKSRWFGYLNNLVVQRVAALLLGVVILMYTVYHVASLFGEEISTVASGVMTETKVVDGKGYIFRDEVPLFSQNKGVADYLKADGAKVSLGESVAVIYENGDIFSNALLRVIDSKIALLEKSAGSTYTLADLSLINDDIAETYYAIAHALASGETGSIARLKEKLLIAMNCYSILTDKSSPVDDALSELVAQREAILAGGGSSTSEAVEQSGYFYSYVDGLEQYFTVSLADGITAEKFYDLIDNISPDQTVTDGAFGKLADSCEWRFVMTVSELNSEHFAEGEISDLKFRENGNVIIPMMLKAKLEDTVKGGAILVFEADRLPDGFVFGRAQSVSVEVSSVSGIYVPKSAMHRSNGSYYVYVLRGSVVRYRKTDVIYEGGDYYLCAERVEGEDAADYLGINELLIISGSNLFDGRILD